MSDSSTVVRASGPSDAQPDSAEASARRKAYSPPEILFVKKLEAVALLCGPPTGKTQGVCAFAQS